jgi:hypothetical protein
VRNIKTRDKKKELQLLFVSSFSSQKPKKKRKGEGGCGGRGFKPLCISLSLFFFWRVCGGDDEIDRRIG